MLDEHREVCSYLGRDERRRKHILSCSVQLLTLTHVGYRTVEIQSRKERQFIQRLGVVEIMRHWDALWDERTQSMPDASVEDLEFDADFTGFPPRIEVGLREPLTPDLADHMLHNTSTADGVRVRRICEARNEAGRSATLITVRSAGISFPTRVTFVAELDEMAWETGVPSFDGPTRPACLDEDDQPYDCEADEIDELAQRIFREAERSKRSPWEETVMREVIETYLKEVGGARGIPIHW